MQEMDRRIATLRLLLADIDARTQQAQQSKGQLRLQLSRVVDFAVRQNAGVTAALSAMSEVEERLAQQDAVLRRLALLRQRARSELDALMVTRGVSNAQARLTELTARRSDMLRQAGGDAGDAATLAAVEAILDIDSEIAQLRAAIQSASEAAARALTAGTDVTGADVRSSAPTERERP